MDSMTFLSLPRLHRELLPPKDETLFRDLPGPILTLWPGLPHPPTAVWMPGYAWTTAQAQSCLRDYAGAAQDGAKGSPVQSQSVPVSLPLHHFFPAEQNALAQFRSSKHADPEADPKPAPNIDQTALIRAQRTLILMWFLEGQILELRQLQAKVDKSRQNLAHWLKNGPPQNNSFESQSDELPGTFPLENIDPLLPNLPAWHTVLEAAWPFFPAQGLTLVTSDADFMDRLRALPPAASPSLASLAHNFGVTCPGKKQLFGRHARNVPGPDSIFCVYPL